MWSEQLLQEGEEMAVNGVIFLFFCSGSFLFSVFQKRRFEQTLPVTVLMAMLLLYLFGLSGKLELGAAFVFLLACGSYLLSIFHICKTRALREVSSVFFTPAFFCFLAAYIFLCYVDLGKLADSWDEFSHWMDCVKAMVYLDDFVTNPKSNSWFQSYPPAMALLQYFVQKLIVWMRPGADFNEWRMYLVYQIVTVSFFFPLYAAFDQKGWLKAVCALSVFFFAPLLFFSEMYTVVWIDPFVGVLAGCGFSYILYHKKKDALYVLMLAGMASCLTLAKDSGLYFAIFIIIASLIDSVGKGTFKQGLAAVCIPAAAVAASKASWICELKASHALIRANSKIDLIAYTKMMLFRKDDTYHQTVADHMRDAFFHKYLTLAGVQIQVSYCAGFLILSVCMFLLSRAVKKRMGKAFAVNGLLILFMCGFYVYSLGAVYIANFSEREAVGLASFSRYVNTAYLAVFLVIIAGVLQVIGDMEPGEGRNNRFVAVLLFVLCFIPHGNVVRWVCRERVRSSIRIRSAYEPLKKLIDQHCDGDDKIYFVSQESNGLDFHITFYNARPNLVANDTYGGWNLGGPFCSTDVSAIQITAEEWQKLLLEGNYDFVAIQHSNTYFCENYSGLFVKPDEIADTSLFRLDRTDGKLRRVY